MPLSSTNLSSRKRWLIFLFAAIFLVAISAIFDQVRPLAVIAGIVLGTLGLSVSIQTGWRIPRTELDPATVLAFVGAIVFVAIAENGDGLGQGLVWILLQYFGAIYIAWSVIWLIRFGGPDSETRH